MREPVALAYLLARLTDTIADTESISPQQRFDSLSALSDAIDSLSGWEGFSEIPKSAGSPGEQNLIRSSQELVQWLERIDVPQRESIQKLMASIVEGQRRDLLVFDIERNGKCLSEEELMQYAHLVAGSVGEFWTEIGYVTLGKRFADPRDEELLMEEGKAYGQGLQLINIIRDIHEDVPMGRFYLPASDQIPGPKEIRHWLSHCGRLLDRGNAYAERIRNRKVRFATLFPLKLAEKTANLIEAGGVEQVLEERIKISRGEVVRSVAALAVRIWFGI